MTNPDPRTLARRGDPWTSRAAAVDVPSNPRATHRARILAAIAAAGPDGLTYEQAGERAHVPNAWRRVSDLLNAGLIEPVPEKSRTMSSGRQGRVYRALRYGLDDPANDGRLF